MNELYDEKLYEIKNSSLLLKLLVTDVQAFNSYREKFPYQEIDFSNYHMKGANLSYANLSYADLQHADLQDADLQGVNLEYANISYANLKDTRLYNATIKLTKDNLKAIKGCKL